MLRAELKAARETNAVDLLAGSVAESIGAVPAGERASTAAASAASGSGGGGASVPLPALVLAACAGLLGIGAAFTSRRGLGFATAALRSSPSWVSDMRTRLLVSVAALAATLLLPAAASAALVRTSAAYGTPVDLTWDPDPSATTQTLYRSAGPCAGLPMPGPLTFMTSEAGGPGLVVGSWSDPALDGDYCYYVEYDAGLGGYSNSLDVTVDTTPPTVTLGGIATNAKVRGTVR